MSEKTFRQVSRDEWFNAMTGNPSVEQIACGALQRIADATELMAKNYAALQAERDTYKRRFLEERACAERVVRSNNALRGYIKRLKKS